MLTKKYYIELARIIKTVKEEITEKYKDNINDKFISEATVINIQSKIAAYLALDNSSFDYERFKEACNL